MHTFTDQNTSPNPLHSKHQHALNHHPLPLQQPTKKRMLPSCHTLRDPLILSVQPNSSFLYRLTLWFIAFCSVAVWTWILAGREEKIKEPVTIITFYGFILLQQWRCHARMAPIFCLVRGSACFYVDDRNIRMVLHGCRGICSQYGVTCLLQGTSYIFKLLDIHAHWWIQRWWPEDKNVRWLQCVRP